MYETANWGYCRAISCFVGLLLCYKLFCGVIVVLKAVLWGYCRAISCFVGLLLYYKLFCGVIVVL